MLERYAYSPYGQLVALNANGSYKGTEPGFGNRYTFTGRRFDKESGLYYYRARYYDAKLGRFISKDPIGMADGPNLYAAYFVPHGVDPTGLISVESSADDYDPWYLAEGRWYNWFTNPISAVNMANASHLTPYVKTTASVNCSNDGCEPEITDVKHSVGGVTTSGVSFTILGVGYRLTLHIKLRNSTVAINRTTSTKTIDGKPYVCVRVTHTYTHDLWVEMRYGLLWTSKVSVDLKDHTTTFKKECCCCKSK